MPAKKPALPGAIPEPENPRAEPGSFVIRGKAWFNEHGEEVTDEHGDIPEEIEEDLVQSGRFLFRSKLYRENNRVPRGATGMYELKWCPVAKKTKNPRKRQQFPSTHISGTTRRYVSLVVGDGPVSSSDSEPPPQESRYENLRAKRPP